MTIEWRVPGDPADITPEAEMEDEDKVKRRLKQEGIEKFSELLIAIRKWPDLTSSAKLRGR